MSINRTAKTWGAEELTSTDLNAEVKALWTGLQAAYDTYTPVRRNGVGGSALTIGNGSITGGYMRVGKKVDFYIYMVVGSSTGTGSTIWTFELPVAPADANHVVGAGGLYDTSAGLMHPVIFHGATGSEIKASNYQGTLVQSTGPVLWASGDQIRFAGTYEAA